MRKGRIKATKDGESRKKKFRAQNALTYLSLIILISISLFVFFSPYATTLSGHISEPSLCSPLLALCLIPTARASCPGGLAQYRPSHPLGPVPQQALAQRQQQQKQHQSFPAPAWLSPQVPPASPRQKRRRKKKRERKHRSCRVYRRRAHGTHPRRIRPV